ncbi:MAG: glycosyltransferase [Pseudomonadota bacterium]
MADPPDTRRILLPHADVTVERCVILGDASGAFARAYRLRNPVATLEQVNDVSTAQDRAKVQRVAHAAGLDLVICHRPVTPDDLVFLHPLMAPTGQVRCYDTAAAQSVFEQQGWHIVTTSPVGTGFVYYVSPQPIQTAPLKIQTYGLQTQHDAMVQVRLARPLVALQGTGRANVRLDIQTAATPIPTQQDVAWFYRVHLVTAERANAFARAGGLLVLDIDDHPGYLPNHVKNDYLTIRGVHAVTVSTPKLADVIRQWTPHVHVFPNALLQMPPPRVGRSDPRVHLVYAALNRTADWQAQCRDMLPYLHTHRDRFRATVLHDAQVAQDLSGVIDTKFQELTKYEDYLALLQTADVMLMPLLDNEFNAVKSDLKLVETLASGAVALVSPAVRGLTDIPDRYFLVAQTPADWVVGLDDLAASRDALQAMGDQGRAYIAQNRLLRHQAHARLDIFTQLRATLPMLETDRQTRLRDWAQRQG